MFEKGEIIEALHPETRCWLTAIFHKQISENQFEIEWYDHFLKHSYPTPTIIVNEIQKQPKTTNFFSGPVNDDGTPRKI